MSFVYELPYAVCNSRVNGFYHIMIRLYLPPLRFPDITTPPSPIHASNSQSNSLTEGTLDYDRCQVNWFTFFVLFCFVLFCFVLFCFVCTLFVLFCFVCLVLFCFVLFCFVLFVWFCFVLFCLFVCLFLLRTTDRNDHSTKPMAYHNSEQVYEPRLEPIISGLRAL